MATIRTFSQVVQSMIDNLRLKQPVLDSKPGTVSRDLMIDNPADQIASIYRDMQSIQKNQSLLTATGQILDQFGSNYGIIRDPGKRAAGNAILTFSTLLNNINITAGSTVTSKSGIVFRITANIVISAATKGVYSSFASSIAQQLHIAGISDPYAVQVPIEALNTGANGNISVYSLIKTSIPGITNVTNIAPTAGGTNPQGDSQYRNQILAGLTGSAAGTSRGYQNALLAVSGIQSVFIASAGSPVLTRDGTVTARNSDGSLFVVTPGTGGKVDIWVQGSDLTNITESYVFHDLSGTGDVTSPLNAHILGQSTNTSNLTPLERRQQYTQSGQLPLQPVDSLLTLTGSVSGANFVQGVNYALVKDTNVETENSAFALDELVFLQNYISIDGENVTKGNSNSVDGLVFSGVKNIDDVHQGIIVTNDVATLNPDDHTQITIPHAPLDTVIRATNMTTGERYVITNQNINSSTGLNASGEVTIAGSVLPSSQDLVQVDYTWDYTYDSNVDYFDPRNSQFVANAIDWGRSNYIPMELGLLARNGNRYNVSLTRNIDRVYTAFYCATQTTTVQQAVLTDQTNAIKALTQITLVGANILNVISVKSQVTGLELFATEVGGTFSGDVVYLATDVAQPSVGESVVVYYNSHEIYNIAKNNGSISGSNIVLSTDDILDFNSVLQDLNDIFNSVSNNTIFVDYIATDIDVVTRTAISSMPFAGSSSTSVLVDGNSNVLTSRQPTEFANTGAIIRSGPANLIFIVDNGFSSGGTFSVRGTGWFKITASVPVSQENIDGNFELLPTITNAIGVVSSTYSVVKVASASLFDGITTTELALRGYNMSTTTYDSERATSLLGMNATSINLHPVFAQNKLTRLTIGSTINFTFYVLAPNVAETIQFTTGRGTLYTKYRYSRIDRIDLVSGFVNPNTSLVTGFLRVARLSQPATSSAYLANYSYFGPVENEQLTIQYRYNNIIADATNAIEGVRTLTADVLTRLALAINVNVSMTIIILQSAISSTSQIIDQATSAINNVITSTPMGTTLDYTAFIRVVSSISGVSGADITIFDYVGSSFNGTANRKDITADQNQYFAVGTINVTPGTR